LAFLEQETCGSIINGAAVDTGLASSVDPLADTSALMVQLSSLFNQLGRIVRRAHQWSLLDNLYSFSTVAGQGFYTLPFDYGRVIDQTQWNRTNRLPQGGPLGPSEWQYLKSRLVGVVFTTLFRVIQGNYRVYPDTNTPGNYVLAYEYISRYWVLPTGVITPPTYVEWNNNTTYGANSYVRFGGNLYLTAAGGLTNSVGPGPIGITSGQPAWAQSTVYFTGQPVTANGNTYICTKGGTSASAGTGPSGTGGAIVDNTCTWAFTATVGASITDGTVAWTFVSRIGEDQATQSNDICLFPASMMRAGLVYAFKKAHRMAMKEDEDDWKDAWQQALDDDWPADILRLDKASGDVPLIGERNVPLTGFGGP